MLSHFSLPRNLVRKPRQRIVQDVSEEETMLMRNAVVSLTAIGLPVLALPLVSCVVVETA